MVLLVGIEPTVLRLQGGSIASNASIAMGVVFTELHLKLACNLPGSQDFN